MYHNEIIDKGVLVFVCDEYVNIFMKEHRCIDYRDVCIILLKKKLAQGWGKYASKCNVLNFDNTYTWQRNLLRFPHEWIDMYDIEGTNLYCDDHAMQEIEKDLHVAIREG